MIDAGIIAPPLLISEREILTLTREESAQLERCAFVPGTQVRRIDPGRDPWPAVEIRWQRPCVTTLPPRAR